MTVPEEITKTINKSDASLLIKVSDFLTEKSWKTVISPYYSDVNLQTSREIDIIATKSEDVYDFSGTKLLGTVTFNLIIECKDIRNSNGKINKNAVFWFDDSLKYEQQTVDWVRKNLSEEPSKWTQLQGLRYFKQKDVAFLFESSKGSAESGIIYKAVTQALHSLIYFRYSRFGKKTGMGHNINLYFPVIIYNDASKNAVYKSLQGVVEKVKDNFLLAMNYSYIAPKTKEPISEFFYLDIVEFSRMETFVEILLEDMSKLKELMRYKRT